MLWKLLGRAFRISLGILSGQGNMPLDRFKKHVWYIIIVNDAASGEIVEEVLFSSMNV